MRTQGKRQEIGNEIQKADVSALHPALNREDLSRALVAQYLSHDGYVETAQAFAQEVQRDSGALKDGPNSSIDSFLAVEDDRDAAHRQRKLKPIY